MLLIVVKSENIHKKGFIDLTLVVSYQLLQEPLLFRNEQQQDKTKTDMKLIWKKWITHNFGICLLYTINFHLI